MNQEDINAGLEAAERQFKTTGDKAGYHAALSHYAAKQSELDAEPVKQEVEASTVRISEAAMEVIRENLLPLELFEDYSVVSVSVARRIAEQYIVPSEEPSEDPVDNPFGGDSPADLADALLERDDEEILGELPDDIELEDEDDEEIEDTAAF